MRPPERRPHPRPLPKPAASGGRGPCPQRGFSMLEVVIAMGILAFGLLTLALMQLQAISQGAAGRHTGDAAAVGRTYLEQVHRVPWSVLQADLGNGWQDPGWNAAPATWSSSIVTPGGSVQDIHDYNVQWRVSAVPGTSCLRDVELRVSWQEEDRSTPKSVVLATRRYNWGGQDC